MDILKLKYIFIYFFQAFCKSTHNEAQFLLSGSCHLSTLQLQFEIIMSDCRSQSAMWLINLSSHTGICAGVIPVLLY